MDLFYFFFQHEFFINALIIGLLSSLICGIIGTFIYIRKIVFITAAMSHASFGGIGIAFYLHYSLIYGSLLYSIIISILIGFLSNKNYQDKSIIISNLWIFSVSLGTLFINISDRYAFDLHSYMFGDIFMVSNIYYIAILTFFIVLSFFLFYKKWIAIAFDNEFLKIKKFPVLFYDILFYIILSISINILIHSVGMILVMALMSIPPSISFILTRSFLKGILLSILFSLFFIYVGIILSFLFNMSSGPLIILPAILIWFLILIFNKMTMSATLKKNEKKIIKSLVN